jgi:hypothetical protein
MQDLNNNRGYQERRRMDSSLPVGCFNRRHSAERRLPEMEMLRLSDMEWQRYFGDSSQLSEKSERKIFPETDVIYRTHHDYGL